MNASPRIITLLYHRVDKPDTDPWGICVSPEHFNEQLRIIKKHLPVITAEQAVQQVINGKIAESSACITFDDGYADNYTTALPILKHHNCPATFFIATNFIDSHFPFWWDKLETICLHSKHLPARLQLVVNDVISHFDFETELTENDWLQHLSWKWYEAAPTMRCQAFLATWNLLRPLSSSLIQKLMNDIRVWSGNHFQTRLPINRSQLQKLYFDELATIGLHTHTHLDLASYSGEIQADDIEESRRILSGLIRTDCSLLAFPYGRYNEVTLAAVKKMKISGCFTTEPLPITAASDVSRLGRYQVCNWNAQQFEEKFISWMSA